VGRRALKTVVGGQTLSVRPADPAHLDTVRRMLHDTTGMAVDDSGNGVLAVAVAGDEVLAGVVGRLAANGITVTELSLRLPSLDEVFFSLTGLPRARAAPAVRPPWRPAQSMPSMSARNAATCAPSAVRPGAVSEIQVVRRPRWTPLRRRR
jgi:hypothetical protein